MYFMRKFTLLALLLFMIGSTGLYAQKTVQGTIKNSEDGKPVIGASIVVKGTQKGAISDVKGYYEIKVPNNDAILVYSFVGMQTVELKVGDRTKIDVSMTPATLEIEGAVVTALGISREKKSLGYATQEVSGEDINKVKNDNFVNSMSGKVSGVQIKTNNNFGGSTNILIRGTTSLTGNNQPLFVVDGVPVSNANDNRVYQDQGSSGYDYGNAVSDINPDNIESINVLKGAAATALYGSRAANGVVIITTKKGKKVASKAGKAFSVEVSTSATMGIVDKSTFPNYQDQYGAGYGPYYSGGDYPGLYEYDYDGDGTDDLVVPTTEDASFGQAFDPDLKVYQWTSFVPEHEDYGKPTPWVSPENGPITFFENSWTLRNSVSVNHASNEGSYRLSYTNLNQTGILPNSELKRNNISFSSDKNLGDNLKVSASANYVNSDVTGRNSTGYSNNIMSSFRQWWQTNIDLKDMEDLYHETNRNVTWNPHSPTASYPEYWNNFYWDRFENYTTDGRDRVFGNVRAEYNLTDHLSVEARATVDYYKSFQEERLADGSTARRWGISRLDVGSGYARYDKSFRENNYYLLAKYNKYLTEDLSLNALLGYDIRRTHVSSIFASTNGGLVVNRLYSLSNSLNNPLAPQETDQTIGVNGLYGSVSLGFKDMIYLDGTLRRDHASTLPADNSVYYYPSVSTSFLFHDLIDAEWLDFAKARVNYAEVGNSAPFASINDVYYKPAPFGSTPLYSVPSTKNNSELRPERTKSIEAGLNMQFADKRFGIDLSVYQMRSIDQILPVAVSTATGYNYKYVNAGEIKNQGIELQLRATPVKTDDFRWDIIANWAKNVNEVVELFEGVDNLQLGSFQGGITINATVGESYGTIQGTDFVYRDSEGNIVENPEDGDPSVTSGGFYEISGTSDKVIGNMNPDWNAGITNALSYKNWSFSFLIDWQQGGDVFSLDQWYGQGTGLYANTVGTNDLGNPLRDPIVDADGDGNPDANSGGYILEGVKEDGTENDIRIPGDRYYAYGWASSPNARYIYDASYVKLREVTLSYRLPGSVFEKSFLTGATFGFVGNNLWIIHKNLPDADPEAGISSGNLQGWQSGVLPTTRNFGININLQF